MNHIEIRTGGYSQTFGETPELNAGVHLQVDIPAGSILDVVPVTGNPKFARELAVCEIDSQKPFGGLFHCIVHGTRRSAEGVQVLCSVVPAQGKGPGRAVEPDGVLRERYLGFGCLVQLCEPGVDVSIQVGVKVYVLRLRNGLYDFHVLPAHGGQDAASVCGVVRELPELDAGTASGTLYYFRLFSPDSGHSTSAQDASDDRPFARVLVGYVAAPGSAPEQMSDGVLAGLLSRGSTREPLDSALQPEWKRWLLRAKRHSDRVAKAEVGLLAVLMAFTLTGVAASTNTYRQLRDVAQKLSGLPKVPAAVVDASFEPEVQAQLRMLQKLGDPQRVNSEELFRYLQALRKVFPDDVRVHEVRWLPPRSGQTVQTADRSQHSSRGPGDVSRLQSGSYEVILYLPASFRARVGSMDAIVSRAARHGFTVEESNSSTTEGTTAQRGVSQPNAATTLLFTPLGKAAV